jgi:hypothetical protein
LACPKSADSVAKGFLHHRLQIFNSPPTKFSKIDHLASTITQVQQIQNGRWVLMKDSLSF